MSGYQVTQENFDEYKTEEMKVDQAGNLFIVTEHKRPLTTIPFVKNNEFDYSWLVWFSGKYADHLVWIIFVLAVIFIVTAVSNGANITDGLDGLTTGSAAIIGITLGILAWLSGNSIYSNYLNIMHIPNAGELVVFAGAFIGATIGFLWYNSYPAQVFMGDTGKPGPGWDHCGVCGGDPEGAFDSHSVRDLPGGERFRDFAGGWFKRTPKKIWGGQKDCFLMAPITSPLPEKRISGTKDCDQVLDRGNHAGSDISCNPEDEIIKQTIPYGKQRTYCNSRCR